MNTQASAPSSGAAPGGPPSGSPAGESFFDRIRSFGVVRPDEGRWAAGVCAGLARRWGLDPLLVRGLFVVASIVSGFGLGLYGLLWLFLPHPDGRIHAQEVLRGTVTAGFVGSILFLLIDFPLSNIGGGWHAGPPFGGLGFLTLVGLGVWWLVSRRGHGPGKDGPGHGGWGQDGPGHGWGHGGWGQTSYEPGAPTGSPTGDGAPGFGAPAYGTPTPGAPGMPGTGGPETEPSAYGYGPAPSSYSPPPAGYSFPAATAAAAGTAVHAKVKSPRRVDVHKPLHSLTLATFGVALVAAGGVLAWDRSIGSITEAGLVATAVALSAVALGIVLAGLLGRRSGGLAPVAIALATVAASGAAWQGGPVYWVDETQSWTPAAGSVPPSGYRLDAGRAVLDLTGTGLATGATVTSPIRIPVNVGVGELVVIVPAGTSTEVNGSVGLGGLTDRVGRNNDTGGPGVSETVTSGPDPVLVVDANVGVGHIEVVPQGTKVDR